ncbi:unnamed protein product (macronuclear) [Paramecium tetraurelia]|uniref:RING-type domain-containing protein n=1 Tax=Paramecium tetraurelia TaxID=5888 RepID=A0D4Y1_PARTE|nr:uncharacterized protein GSPATT00013545001 [Paramecium tetraurelia]CAK78098.1 unnamed protein product [Paramecium tetraurelia]|eukprot:XP_001445495.1 hypothetical protein (macronuclear) [Paramecium tetraurelia strain d4-2]
MEIFTFDNCDHSKEFQLLVQYYSVFDEDVESSIRTKSIVDLLDAGLEIQEKFRNKAKQEKQTQKNFKTPLDFLRDSLKNKIDNTLSFQQILIFSNPQVVKNFGKPKVVHHNGEFLLVGGSLGNILYYSQQQMDIIIQQQKIGAVTALDSLNELVAVGYESGWISIINMKKKKHLCTCQNITKSKIIVLKFIFQSKKFYNVVTSDDVGVIRIVNFRKGMLGFDYEIQLTIPRQQFPMLNIVVLYKNETKEFMGDLYEKSSRIIGLCSLSKFYLITVYKDDEKKLKSIIEIENPHVSAPEKPFYCYLSCGYGVLPPPNQEQEEQWKEKRLIILLCWNCHMFILIRSQDQARYMTLKPLIFKQQIHAAYFVEQSIIEVITANQNIYLFNTLHLELHVVPKGIEQIPYFIQKKNWPDSPFTSLYQVEVLCKDEGIAYKQYPLQYQIYTLNKQTRQIHILVEGSIVTGSINNLEQSIDIFIQNKDWAKGMLLILALMDGSMKSTPIKFNMQVLKKKVLEIATHYIKVVLEEIKTTLDKHKTLIYTPTSLFGHQQDVEKVKTLLSMLVDFLLRVSSDILFNQIYSIIRKFLNGDISIICNELSLYLKNGKVKVIDANEQTINEILTYYVQKGEQQCIEAFIQKIDYSKINTEQLIQFCLLNKLTTSLSYVCTRSGDFLTPLAKLWGIIQQDIKKKDPSVVIEQGKSIIHYLEQTLHIEQLIKEKSDQISLWLFEVPTLFLLMSIEFGGCVQLCYKFFIPPYDQFLDKERLKKYYVNMTQAFQKLKTIKDQNDLKFQLTQLQIKTLPDAIGWDKMINQVGRSIQASILSKGYTEQLQNKQLTELLLDLVSEHRHLIFLPLQCLPLPNILHNDEPTLKYCLIYAYNQFIINLFKKYTSVDKEDILNSMASDGQFDWVKMYLNEELKSYSRALDFRIKIKNQLQQFNIQVKFEIFTWISKILSRDPPIPQIDSFRDRILHHIGSLVSYSAIHTRSLISKYFQANDISILNKMGELPKLQLEYLEQIMQVDRKQYQSNTDLLKLYIKLLCQIKPEKVLKELQEQEYPLDDIIGVLKQYPVPDALVYLLERSGAITEAISVKLDDFIQKIQQKAFLSKSEFYLYFLEICNICFRNKKLDELDESWDMVTQCILELSQNRYTPQPYPSYLEEYIPLLLKKWAECSHLDAFLHKITTKYMRLSSAKLKMTFLSMYTHINFSTTVYTKLVDINFIKCVQNMRTLVHLQLKGQGYLPGCYLCYNYYDYDQQLQPIIVLACGHTFHFNCLNLDEKAQYHCPVCLKSPRIAIVHLLHQLKSKKYLLKSENQQQQQNIRNQNPLVVNIIKQGQKKQQEIDQNLKFTQNESEDDIKRMKQMEKLKKFEQQKLNRLERICQGVMPY